MKDTIPKLPEGKKTCDSCGGSGQIGYFGGVSRFVTSWEECWECNGTGYTDNEEINDQEKPDGQAPPEETP